MNIDKLNGVQNNVIAYTPTKYVKSEEKGAVSKRDTLTLTEEAQQFLAQNRKSSEEKQKSTKSIELDMLRRQMEGAEKSESKIVNIAKCFKIARRIQNGDKVPLKDIKFLMENEPELYKHALMFKKHNPEPKKYKSCLDKEDEKGLSESQGGPAAQAVSTDEAAALDLSMSVEG